MSETENKLETGIQTLRDADQEPLRLWTQKAPKTVGGVIQAVFLQATNEVVLIHQFESGKFTLFNKAAG